MPNDVSAVTPFLERRSYHRRRILDGLRLLPLVGAWLFMIPLLWPDGSALPPSGTAGATPTSLALIYVFSSWLVLIVVGAALVAWVRRMAGPGPNPGPDRG